MGQIFSAVLAGTTKLDDGLAQAQKAATDTMVDLVVVLTRGEPFAEAGIAPLTLPEARLLIGGIRELTARTLEDGEDLVTLRATIGQAAIALLEGR